MTTLWSATGIRHTVFDSAVPHLPGLEYARNMLAALAFCPQAKSALVLGLGGGSIPRMLLAARPRIEVDTVEIDPAVVELAVRYFDVRALPGFSIHQEDAAGFLQRCKSQYGVIVVDTYLGDQFPDQCATKEFFRDARQCLLDDGVLVINWMNDDVRKSDGLLRKLRSLVGPVWQLPGLKSHNVLYFAAAGKTTRSAIVSAASAVSAEVPFENPLKQLAQRLKSVR
jgi:spermidine synthase